MKLIIAGGRDFSDYKLLCLTLLEYKDIDEIVCGAARGADTLGSTYAISNNIPIKYFPANWDKYGKQAGFIRNAEMAEYGTHLLAFWDGKSKGTKHMIDTATKKGLSVQIVRY